MTETLDFDQTIDRTGTSSFKWEKYRGRDILPYWVADMDFISPQAVIDALQQRVAHGVFGYTQSPEKLHEAVCERLEEAYGWLVKPHWLVWLPGVVTGLNLACRSVGTAGSPVFTAVPIYPPFLSAPGFSDRRLVRIEMHLQKGQWHYDFDRLNAAAAAEGGLLMLCNPHNPVGRVYSRSELERLAQIATERNLVVCSDEIHCDLILDTDKSHLPFAALDPEIARRTITLMSPSKTYNLPGLGCAFAVIGDQSLRRRFRAAMAGIVPHVNALGYTAALAAYRNGSDWLGALLTYLRRNRDSVVEAVERMPGLQMSPVEATYLAWIDARGTGIETPIAFFEAAGVGLSDGGDFGAPGFVRLNFGCSRDMLQQGLRRMERALAEYR